MLMVCAVLLGGCPDWTGVEVRDARVASNMAAMTLEATQSTAELLYLAEQRFVVDKAQTEEGMTKELLAQRVAVVRQRWAALKELFPKARSAQSKLAALLEQDTVGASIAALAIVTELTGLQAQIAEGVAQARSRLEGM
jgi:hypothetical protein